MDLSFRDLGGEGGPIVILHGLFGSSQNWAGMGRRLSRLGHVFALDLRNHGDSPHDPSHSLADCVQDLLDWVNARASEPVRLIGHSMGGLIAMGFAIRHPGMTAGVASIDIAPRPYPPEQGEELRALKTDISGCRSRAELDQLLLSVVPDLRMRQFLLTNAARKSAGYGFRWKPNVGALERSTVAADWATMSGSFGGEALLVAAGRSEYVRAEDHAVMLRYFPRARIETLPDADHWPHVTSPAALEASLRRFLDAIERPAARH
ncbi:MAG: alpha/beta fold hydrolase [Spirochaetia bacterium]|jgi:pimeloyl-ACP methyl ester carboxylesterase